MIVIGIDPGLTGALASVDASETCAISDLPTVDIPGEGRTQRKIDAYALTQLLKQHLPLGERAIVVMEDVHAMASSVSGSGANTSLMHTKGMIEGVVGSLGLTLRLVNSQRWKRYYGIGADKRAAITTILALYPQAADMLARVKDHNRAEALLIAHYGLRKLT